MYERSKKRGARQDDKQADLATEPQTEADSNLRLLPATACQLTADSLLFNDSPLARRMSMHDSLTDLCDNHFQFYSSVVSGIFPSQLEILSTSRPISKQRQM